ncbi:GPI-GlcNAc transferase complex, PIG-H component-domain-containing protein [Chytriomyces sp. MP71]|nr:GPI-GlcNAc transferase complex, PIG-H component-domain-containing protein [Chytriomyces sp. MP71]
MLPKILTTNTSANERPAHPSPRLPTPRVDTLSPNPNVASLRRRSVSLSQLPKASASSDRLSASVSPTRAVLAHKSASANATKTRARSSIVVEHVQHGTEVAEFRARRRVSASGLGVYTEIAVMGAFAAVVVGHLAQTSTSLWDSILVRLLIPIFILWLYWRSGTVREESLLVIRNVGLQTRTTNALGSSSTTFVPVSKVAEVIVNEGITMFQVRYYLAVVVSDRKEMLVIFESFLPKLEYLKPVYWETRRILFNETPPSAYDVDEESKDK